MIAIGHASILEPPSNATPCSASIGPGNRSRRRSLFSSRAAVRVSEPPPGQVERGGGGGEGVSSVKHTNTAFTHLSLSVNDSNCKDTVSDSQNKDQVYQLLHVDRAYLQTSTAEVGQEAYMKNIAHIKHLYDA